jgi:hypothetical protein
MRSASAATSALSIEDTEGYYRQALAIAEPRGMHPLIAHRPFGLVKLYHRTGNRGQAQEHLTIFVGAPAASPALNEPVLSRWRRGESHCRALSAVRAAS